MFQIKHVTPPASNGTDAGTLIGDGRTPTAVAKQLRSNSREDSAVAFDVLRAETMFAAWDSAQVQIGLVLSSLTSKNDLPALSLWNWAKHVAKPNHEELRCLFLCHFLTISQCSPQTS